MPQSNALAARILLGAHLLWLCSMNANYNSELFSQGNASTLPASQHSWLVAGSAIAEQSTTHPHYLFVGLWEDSNGAVLLLSADGTAEWTQNDISILGEYDVELSEIGIFLTISFLQRCSPQDCTSFRAARRLHVVRYTRHTLEIYERYFKQTFLMRRLP